VKAIMSRIQEKPRVPTGKSSATRPVAKDEPAIAARPKGDQLKLFAAAALVIAALAAFYYFRDVSVLFRTLGLLAVMGGAVALFLPTAKGRELTEFSHNAQVEVRKVIWPTRQETLRTTGIVMIVVFVMAIFLWILDIVFAWGIRLFTGQGG
jgi:preprotein translocase subunit SecE